MTTISGTSSISYDEILKDTARFNSFLLKSRKSHLPFLDSSTGIAQRPCQLYKRKTDRIKTNGCYIFSYKPLRWKKQKNNYPVLVKSITMGGFGYGGNVQITGNVGNNSNFDAPDSITTFDEEFNTPNTTVNELSQFVGEDSEEEQEVVEVTRRRGGGRRGRGSNGNRATNTRGSGIGPRRRSSNVANANLLAADEDTPSAKVTRSGNVTTLTPPLLTNATLIPPVGLLRSQPPKLESSHHSTPHQDESSTTSSSHSPAAASIGIHGNLASKASSLPSNNIAKAPSALITPKTECTVVTTPFKSAEEPKKTPQSQSGTTTIKPLPTFCDFNCSFRRAPATGEASNSQKGKNQVVQCRDCEKMAHPVCLSFNENMRVSVTRYEWQCLECKTCWVCGTAENDDEMLFCDDCDRGYHMYCLQPPLTQAPEGNWSCDLCLNTFREKAASSTNTLLSTHTITVSAGSMYAKKEKQ